MPIKQAGMLASRVSTWPRDHFCRSTIAPRPSRPTTWNEFLPISIPITAITLLSFSDMACSFRWVPPASLLADRGAGARLDHPISGHGAARNSHMAAALDPPVTARRRTIGSPESDREARYPRYWSAHCERVVLVLLMFALISLFSLTQIC